jgi:catechol 2,3-dioxygenase-like lactoylglutathione lyase family enzyme
MATNDVPSGGARGHLLQERPRLSNDGAVNGSTTHGGTRLTTAVMFVDALESSVAFYRELLGMEVKARDELAALLVSADGSQLYLRDKGKRASHYLGSVGVQYVIWAAADEESLRRCERFLKEGSAHVATQDVAGFTFVEGRDPNGLPVMITYPGPDLVERHQIMARIYSW